MACGTNCVYCGLLIQLFILSLCVFCEAAIQDENLLIDTEDSLDYSSDDIRCYCNLPVCVSTSYMCKSEAGVCFSEPVEEDLDQPAFRAHEVYKRRHGCLELLPDEDQRDECRNMPSGSSRGQERSLFCCIKDMCNHADSKDPYDGVFNTTRMVPDHSAINNPEMMSPSPGYNSNEVWFKAAIIAVPICGVVILFLLIFLACKILKTDSLSTSDKLGVLPYSHGSDRKSNRDHFDQVHQSSVSSKKIPLLMHHHELTTSCTNHSSDELLKAVPLLLQNETGVNHSYDKKNEANAKLNEYNLVQNKENNSPLLGLHKSLNTSSCNNMYRNVNLSVTPVQTVQPPMADKLYDKKGLNSVISWGPSHSSSPV